MIMKLFYDIFLLMYHKVFCGASILKKSTYIVLTLILGEEMGILSHNCVKNMVIYLVISRTH